MAIYETMLIMDTQNEPQVIEEELDKITGFVESNGGSMHLLEKVGRRRLAYDIAGRSDGYYAVLYYNADPSQIAPLQRILKLNEAVLRHMVIRRDKLPDGPMMVPGEPLRPPVKEPEASAAPAESVPAPEVKDAPVEPEAEARAEGQPEEDGASTVEPTGEASEEKSE